MADCTTAPTVIPVSLSSHVHCETAVGGGGLGGGSSYFSGIEGWDMLCNSSATNACSFMGNWCKSGGVGNATANFYHCSPTAGMGTCTACWQFKYIMTWGFWASNALYPRSTEGIIWKCNNECRFRWSTTTIRHDAAVTTPDYYAFSTGSACTDGASWTATAVGDHAHRNIAGSPDNGDMVCFVVDENCAYWKFPPITSCAGPTLWLRQETTAPENQLPYPGGWYSGAGWPSCFPPVYQFLGTWLDEEGYDEPRNVIGCGGWGG